MKITCCCGASLETDLYVAISTVPAFQEHHAKCPEMYAADIGESIEGDAKVIKIIRAQYTDTCIDLEHVHMGDPQRNRTKGFRDGLTWVLLQMAEGKQ
jgi:hypothetical protein